MVQAVFPGSFDPLTLGHLSIINRASQLFDELHIAIAENQSASKSAIWSLADRKQFIEAATQHLSNIHVHIFSGLLVNFLKAKNIPLLVRGARSAVDWNYESELFHVYKMLWPAVETVVLPADIQYDIVSSTYVREIWKLGGDISGMVPSVIIELMEQKKRS